MSDAVTDTHALIWYLEDSPRLSTAANEVFNKCDKGELLIYIPTICLVEIVYLQEKGRISPVMKAQLDTALATEISGLLLANLTAGVADSLAKIPRNIVPDMPDRIIAATAKHLSLPLISKDNKITSSGISIIW
ncbi:type II toxin-antitoxin system VapC family toxin [Plectonema cf. radiosum LEGE 06105]|uniref:Type II toxin-antitoxin system VapC family toxin n=1 Tax=Plectonema cf. radiosum LEGE 06105 TaxID=945769 RepID=A0A8J7F5A7_9CYAN|nr:type II toxin-antitoxin system VapC family toxin [Plectonema radiosum]MBE9215490.1 type II toxin-antitoxin system VapC family toxin [Plectonema cf. radiosum LEGE 06105]